VERANLSVPPLTGIIIMQIDQLEEIIQAAREALRERKLLERLAANYISRSKNGGMTRASTTTYNASSGHAAERARYFERDLRRLILGEPASGNETTTAEKLFIDRMAANFKSGMSVEDAARSVLADDTRLTRFIQSGTPEAQAAIKAMATEVYFAIRADVEINRQMFVETLQVTEEIRLKALSS
jgi:hypothetical protein